MKLFYSKIGSQTININGENVKFVNCLAEVDDNFGQEALKLGLDGLYEDGKQPAYETPKEVQMMSEFKDKEDFYQEELGRLRGIIESQKKKIEGLEIELQNWKNEYEKEHQTLVNYVEQVSKESVLKATIDEGSKESEDIEGAPDDASDFDEESLRQELFEMKKDDLIAFAEKECGIPSAELKGLKKDAIVDKIMLAQAE